MQPLNAREWLESQRLAGCEFAPELLEMLDDQDRREWLENLTEGLEKLVPKDRRNPSTEKDFERLEEAITDQIHLLGEIRDIIEEFAEGFTCANGSRPVDLDDLLRAMFESGRWQKFDL